VHAEPVSNPDRPARDPLGHGCCGDRAPDGLTRWEVTSAQALSDAGYATGMWGKWHLGSDPENRSPVDFGFDEAVWSPRTAR
jgi:arylsulfatase A-like enzyme